MCSVHFCPQNLKMLPKFLGRHKIVLLTSFFKSLIFFLSLSISFYPEGSISVIRSVWIFSMWPPLIFLASRIFYLLFCCLRISNSVGANNSMISLGVPLIGKQVNYFMLIFKHVVYEQLTFLLYKSNNPLMYYKWGSA